MFISTRLNKFIAALLIIFLCVGCATEQHFTQAPKVVIPNGKALIYIYRKPHMSGCMDTASIKINGQLIGYSKNGSAISHVIAPGKISIISNKGPGYSNFGLISLIKNQSSLEVPAEAGKTYYVRVDIVQAPLGGLAGGYIPKLEWVRDETGASEIMQCKIQ